MPVSIRLPIDSAISTSTNRPAAIRTALCRVELWSLCEVVFSVVDSSAIDKLMEGWD